MNRQSNFAGLTTIQLRLISTSSPAAKPPFKNNRPEKGSFDDIACYPSNRYDDNESGRI